MLDSLLGKNRIDQDVLFALKWKKPSTINVFIDQSEIGYFAKVTNLEGNVVTQAKDGMRLVELVNEAVYDFLDIPVQYRSELGFFLPPEDVREAFKLAIPQQYLGKEIGLATA